MRWEELTDEQVVLLMLPPLLLASTYLCFLAMVRIAGATVGYWCGYLFYWSFWCVYVPLRMLGWRRVRKLLRPARWRKGWPAILRGLFLLAPAVFLYLYRLSSSPFVVEPWTIVGSVAMALVNGVLEEVLWRGLYLEHFREHLLFGYLYPAFGFGISHLPPQAVYPSRMLGGAWPLVGFLVVAGLMWGWVARRTDSIRETTAAHVLLDIVGFGGGLYWG